MIWKPTKRSNGSTSGWKTLGDLVSFLALLPATIAQRSGQATSSAYWDCNAGRCQSGYTPNFIGFFNPLAMCYTNAMFAAPPNQYGAKFYGTAATSAALAQGDFCNKCYKVIGRANVRFNTGQETIIIVRSTNECTPDNPICAAGPHIDIAAPGFDDIRFSQNYWCPANEPGELSGFTACSGYNANNPGCDCNRFRSTELRLGCENYLSLGWANNEVFWEELPSCPPELSHIPTFTHHWIWPPLNCVSRWW